MSRFLVTGLFGAFTLAAGSGALAAWADALAQPGVRPTALAAHWTLKLGVVLAFCVFVFLREPSKRPSREPVAFLACAAAILAVIALREPPAEASTALVVAGELVTLAFGAWLLASVLALGRCFGVLPEARGLVTNGPYRFVRHPVYLGELGAAAGLVLAAPTTWNVGVLAVFFSAQAVRMRLEEQALAAEFSEYAAYAACTPRLVPRPRLGGPRPARGTSVATLALAAALLGAPAAVGALDVPPVHGPAEGTIVDTLPAFGWDTVPGAERYEWQIAADAAFNSPVLGSSYDRFFTKNTRATMTKVVPNGEYWWRVRAVAPDGAVSQWSSARSITKHWAAAPTLAAPDDGATISYPQDPFALSWSAVPGAARYLVRIGTDPTLASLVLPGGGIETQATTFTLLGPLAPGKTYYWGITPIDAAGNHGEPSAVRSFTWLWPSGTEPAVLDVAAEPEIYDHRFEWDPVPGAAGYEVEVSSSSDFAPGSRACCPVNSSTGLTTIGTSYSPAVVLQNNNRYYWRVRAIDANGNAGVWNLGPEFLKAFDVAPPSIENLRLSEGTSADADVQTTTPVVLWDAVPGASSYEVEVTRFLEGCQWTATQEHWRSTTASTAWTPLGWGWNRQKPYQTTMGVANDTPSLVAGHSYCVRVTALDRPSDGSATIRSSETYLPDENTPAFTWLGPPAGDACSPSCANGAPGHDDYVLPLRGATVASVPVFRWRALAGYGSYFVIVAKDEDFTNVVDYAFTRIPAYAPRGSSGPRTYADETTLYYWAVLPATGTDGSGVITAPRFSVPASFHKESQPPTLLEPAAGAALSGPPVFHWLPAPGARRYRVEIASDPSFTNVVDSVVTDSTSYTSSATYPADATLHWRVRVDAEDSASPSGTVALRWSAPRTFSKTLPAPELDPDNPTAGDFLPTWTWDPVPGAVSYDFQLRFPNGSLRDFHGIPSSSATPTLLKGTGIWTWQVRANFPRVSSSSVTPGPWSEAKTFTRTIKEPANPSEEVAGRRVVLSWSPKLGALNYRVQISTRADFGALVQSATTDNPTYAPLLTHYQYALGGTFYWRVAAADDPTANAGDFTAPRSFTLPPVTILKAGSRITVKVTRVRGTLRVSGVVTPSHRGYVKVALARKRGGVFRTLASRSATLTTSSVYATSFSRPASGSCRATATFPGDRDHLPSTVKLKFRC